VEPLDTEKGLRSGFALAVCFVTSPFDRAHSAAYVKPRSYLTFRLDFVRWANGAKGEATADRPSYVTFWPG